MSRFFSAIESVFWGAFYIVQIHVWSELLTLNGFQREMAYIIPTVLLCGFGVGVLSARVNDLNARLKVLETPSVHG
jgi:hypothetical protein